jgi:8-oxo-dGTP pyrophosphatase MutT (NUDIX family)
LTDAVPVREAATVILLRDSSDGLQTWLLRRVARMAFAGGMSVFPGGAVEESDRASGDRLHSIADQLGTDHEHAGRLVCAAIRETFEEVGVLLCEPAAVPTPRQRHAVERHDLPFADLLAQLDTAPDISAIHPWSRWITPAGEARRYDTYFFVAAGEEAAHAQALTTEAVEGGWLPIEQALDEYRHGSRPLMPPTLATLGEIAAFGSVDAVLAAAPQRLVSPIRPKLHQRPDGSRYVDVGDGRDLPLPVTPPPRPA